MSCNQLFIFLATAEMLREDHSAPTTKRSELHTTELCVLTKRQRRNRTTSIDAEDNLSPDSLSRMRVKKLSAKAGFELVVATGQDHISPPGIATSGHEASMSEEFMQPRINSDAQFLKAFDANAHSGLSQFLSVWEERSCTLLYPVYSRGGALASADDCPSRHGLEVIGCCPSFFSLVVGLRCIASVMGHVSLCTLMVLRANCVLPRQTVTEAIV